MKANKYAPKSYVGSDMESIASVINIGYLLLPIFLTIILIRQLFEDDFYIAIVVLLSLVFSFFVRYIFLKGQLRQSVILVVVFFNIFLTIVCSLGNGINDIGIIGYPIIIGFSAIILDQQKLIMASTLSIVGVIWLVVGNRLDLYDIVPVPIGSAGDFMVSSLLIAMGGFVAFSLTSNMKQSLKDAQQEISISKKEAKNLEKETNEKLEIIEEIHRAVINSLTHIQELIDYNQNRSDNLTPTYQSLKRKVLVIEVAHKILLSKQAPIQLDIGILTTELLNQYERNLRTHILHIDSGNTPHFIPLDLAINYGICLLELIDKVDDVQNEMLRVTLSLNHNTISLKITDFEIDIRDEYGMVLELLIKQLKGKIERKEQEITLMFEVT